MFNKNFFETKFLRFAFVLVALNAVDIQGFLQGGFVNINRLCPVVERERMEYANPTRQNVPHPRRV